MPTNTFFNLPPPKRERLLRAAVSEFMQKPFNEVSVNRIIRAAQIPRGSFYQYFSDKSDLFRHILSHYGRLMEDTILSSIDACGGDLLAAPLALFDQTIVCIRGNRLEFQILIGIFRQNAGMDASQMWDFTSMARIILGRADMNRLNITGQEKQIALLDLLFSSTVQALMAASCGKLTVEECRERLINKIAIIRRGVEIKEEPC